MALLLYQFTGLSALKLASLPFYQPPPYQPPSQSATLSIRQLSSLVALPICQLASFASYQSAN
jgi:hypothetical protein